MKKVTEDGLIDGLKRVVGVKYISWSCFSLTSKVELESEGLEIRRKYLMGRFEGV